MEKQQMELFKAIRDGDVEKARRAYEKGANVNWPLDRWMVRGRPQWGLRVHIKPMGVYLGFSARESWSAPPGEDVHRGDTLIMAALKCRKTEEVRFLLGCDRLNLSRRNEAGNSALDIARATGQEFLMRDTFTSSVPVYGQGSLVAAPPGGPGAPVGPAGFLTGTVVAQAVAVSEPQASFPAYDPQADAPGAYAPGGTAPGAYAPGAYAPGASAPGAYAPGAYAPGGTAPGAYAPGAYAQGAYAPGGTAPGAYAPGAYATAQPVGAVQYEQRATVATGEAQMYATASSTSQPVRNPVGPAVGRPSPYDPTDGRGRARLGHRGGVGTVRAARRVYGFF